jgi:hypothetical protein
LCASAHQEGVFSCARLSPKNAPFTPSTLVRVAGHRTISEKELVSAHYPWNLESKNSRLLVSSTAQSYKDEKLTDTVNSDSIERRIVAHDSSGGQLSKFTVIVHY